MGPQAESPASRETVPDARETRPSLATAGAAEPPPSLARYEIVRELGRGGMGVVYLARDRSLGREVALKLLRAEDEGEAEVVVRFLREARAAARLSHPHVVATFDVGVSEGKHWFTMEVVAGGSLADRIRRDGRLAPHEAMRLVREAAEGVAYAHDHGIVHRDLKPENLLLDEAGRIKVSDFGLARLVADEGAQRLTRTGAVMGTPAHMSPEQAEGDHAATGPASDVYSLGSVLYEAVTGKLPYGEGSPLEVLFRKMATDPVPPRKLNPDLAPDVATIVLKALERDPARRYATARELADDIGRWLTGQVIRARPASGWYRAQTWARRNRGLSIGAAVAALALVAGGGMAAYQSAERARAARDGEEARRRVETERERADQARQTALRQLRKVAEVCLQATLELRRRGILAAHTAYLPTLEEAFQEATREAPDRPEPYYHLGRMKRALVAVPEALALQEEALKRSPDFAPARYERAVMTAPRYSERLEVLRDSWRREEGRRLAASGALQQGGLGGAELRTLPPDEELVVADGEAARLRATLLGDLAALERLTAAGGAEGLTPGMLDCVRGFQLFHTAPAGADPAEARACLEAAVAAEPTLEEAYEGLARIAFAVADLPAAIDAYTRGLAVDQGYLPHLYRRADIHHRVGYRAGERGQDPTEAYAKALADLDRLIGLAPRSTAALVLRGIVHQNLGSRRGVRGEDPGEEYARAEADFGRVVELDPSGAEGWMRRGSLRMNLANAAAARGEDAEPLYARAEADLTEALRLDPASVETWQARATVRLNRGASATNRGADPEEHLRGAEEDFGAALERNPRSGDVWGGRATVHGARASRKRLAGGDPAADFARAEADYLKALGLKGWDADLWMRWAVLCGSWGDWLATRGEDPAALYQQAIEHAGRGLALNAGDAESWMRCGLIRLNAANATTQRGGLALELLAGAEADLTRAIDLASAHAGIRRRRAQARINLGVTRQPLGLDPEPSLRAAIADLDEAVRLEPGHAGTVLQRAQVRHHLGDWAEAAADYARAAKLHPDLEAKTAAARQEVERHAAAGTPRPSLAPAAERDWRAPSLRAQAALEAGDVAAATREYVVAQAAMKVVLDALGEAARGRFLATPEVRAIVARGHFDTACMIAARLAAPDAATAEEAAKLRDQAFEQLRAAQSLGGVEPERVRDTKWLEPLRGDARWGETVAGRR